MQAVMQIPGNGWTLLWVLSKCCTFDWALVVWLNHYFSAGMWWSHGPVGIQDRIERGCPILFLEIYLPTWLVGSVVFDQVWSWTLQEGRSPNIGHSWATASPEPLQDTLIPSLKTVHDSTMIEIQPTTVPDQFNQISAIHKCHFKMERPTFKNERKFNTVNKHTGRHFELLFNTWTQSELY